MKPRFRPLPYELASLRSHCSRGFTLIELMVAMLLGLIVIAGVASVFLANLHSYRSNEALGDVESNSRIAFSMLSDDIRQAGLTGCNSFTDRLTNVLNNQADHWWADWSPQTVVRGFDDAANDGALDDLAGGDGAPVAGTSSLRLIGAGGQAVATRSYYTVAGGTGSLELQNNAAGFEAGDIVMLCDPGISTLFQVSDYDANTITVEQNGLNDAVVLGAGTDDHPSPKCLDKALSINCFPPNSLVSRLTARDWYIGTNSVGGKSLYRRVLQGGAMQTQEMVRNVTDMKVTYHEAGVDDFTDAMHVGDWSAVDTVRVRLRLESADKRAGTDAKAIARVFTSTINIRNRVH